MLRSIGDGEIDLHGETPRDKQKGTLHLLGRRMFMEFLTGSGLLVALRPMLLR